jgi:3-deoxy-D-manno-octulosonate 8-phosphate phosphatase (KDO 8-P phosphatase)
MKQHPVAVVEAARKIRLIVFDVDGVLTDGMVTFTSTGEELKSFNVRDGHAIRMAFRGGMDVAVITGRESSMVQRRCGELGIKLLYQGIKDKHASFEDIMERTGYAASEIAYMGDDVVDLPVMMSAGLGCCPSDAAEEVLKRSDLVAAAPGGKGAARELVFFILQAKGLLEGLMERYTS